MTHLVRRHGPLGQAAVGLALLILAGCAAPGEVAQTSTFDIATAAPADIAAALEADGRVTARGVLFATDSATLTPEAEDLTARVAVAMRDNPDIRLAVVGHTDDTGAFDYNKELSERRAEAIVSTLIRTHGIADTRLAAVGVGSLAPVGDNATPEGRAENRRVEFVLVR